MGKKEEFKQFVQNNPSLLRHIKDESMTWQKFYEIYDMYGEDENVWKDYLVEVTPEVSSGTNSTDFVGWLKNIDLDRVSEGIGSFQRVLGVLGDLSNKETPKDEYKPRPIYKNFED